MSISNAQVSRYFEQRLADRRANLTRGREASVRCPFHDDKNASMSINTATGLWCCHASCGGGNIVQFEMKLSHTDYATAAKAVAEITGAPIGAFTGPGKPEAVYTYVDEQGRYLFEKVRYPGKNFRQRKHLANGKYESSLGFAEGKTRKVLYHLPEVITAREVVICEGEKDCDNLNREFAAQGWRDIVATTNPDGAGHWLPEFSPFLTGKKLAVFADNDKAGRDHAEMVANNVFPSAVGVKVIHLSGLPEKGDVSDYLGSHTVKDLLAEIRNAPLWTPSTTPVKSTSVGVLLSDVQPESVEWLWQGRIPLGKLTLLEGDPGLGKSVLSLDLAARVTCGDVMPDGTSSVQGGVVLVNTEDGMADTVVPRLDAAGADRSRILAITEMPDGEYTRLFSLVTDLHVLEEKIQEMKAVLVVIDPLMAFLDKGDSHKDQDVRQALSPLASVAERTGAAILVVRHLNKTGGQGISAIYRGGGSIGIIGAARSALLVGKDPQDENASIVAPVKSNLAKLAPSLRFTKEEAANGAVKISWQGEVDYSADELVSQTPTQSSVSDEEFVRSYLANGPVLSKELEEAAAAQGISLRKLNRIRKALGVEAERSGFGAEGKWMVRLPPKECQPDHTLPTPNNSNNATNDQAQGAMSFG